MPRFKFYLQDTKSSNGTFLNGNRLGKSNEDSAPYELTSSDIIQFGVDVTENTKKGNRFFSGFFLNKSGAKYFLTSYYKNTLS